VIMYKNKLRRISSCKKYLLNKYFILVSGPRLVRRYAQIMKSLVVAFVIQFAVLR